MMVSTLNYLKQRPLALFLVLSLFLCFETLILGPFSYIRIHDVADSFTTKYMMLGKDFWEHGPTYWYPYLVGGFDRISQDILYTHFFEILFLVLPGVFANQITVFLIVFVSSYFTFRVCREHLNLSLQASVLAALFYTQPAEYFVNDQLGWAIFPAIVLYLATIHTRMKEQPVMFLWVVPLAIVYVMSSSLPISVPFTMLFIPLWLLIVLKRWDIRMLLLLFVFAVLVILMELPAIEVAQHNSVGSHRESQGQVSIGNTVQTYWYLFTSAIEIFFSYPECLLLGAMGIVFSRLKGSPANRMLLLIIFAVMCQFVGRAIQHEFYDELGAWRGFGLHRFRLVAILFVTMYAGYGFDCISSRLYMVHPFKNRSYRARDIVFSGFIVWWLFFAFYNTGDQVSKWVLLGNAQAIYENSNVRKVAQEAEETLEPFRVGAIQGIAIHNMQPGYLNAHGLETVGGYGNLYPRTYQNFWAKMSDPLFSRNSRLKKYVESWGNRLYLFVEEEITQELPFADFYHLHMLSLANTKYIFARRKLEHEHLELKYAAETNWYELSGKVEKLGYVIRRNFTGREDLWVYENKTVLPRMFLVPQVAYLESGAAILDQLADSDVPTIRETLLVEQQYEPELASVADSPAYQQGTVTMTKYSPDIIEATATLDGAGYIVVGNSFHRDWKATVDGEEVPIVPAYATFWAIPIKAGTHEIRFSYHPPLPW